MSLRRAQPSEARQSMTKQIEFLFDYGSPFSYLASTQMPEFGKRNATTIIYVPIALGAVLKATGNASPMAVPAKGNYMAIELRRWAKRYAVPFRANPHPFMRNTMRLVRGRSPRKSWVSST